MTKADIVEDIAQRTGLTKKEVSETVDLFLKKIGDLLVDGQHLEIRGFGTFKVKERKERMARNPRTGDAVPVPSRKVPVFKVSKMLKDRVATDWRAEVHSLAPGRGARFRGPEGPDRPDGRARPGVPASSCCTGSSPEVPRPLMIDLRSDTVTRPTAAMRAAMAAAEVGDDVFGDDPTVHRLQDARGRDCWARRPPCTCPAARWATSSPRRPRPSPGDQVMRRGGAHIYRYEAGAPGAPERRPADRARGRQRRPSTGRRIAAVAPPDDVHAAPPALVCLENTHNRAGGRILPQADGREIGQRGARARACACTWTARACGTPTSPAASRWRSWPRRPTRSAVCFSKGLGAPVGSCARRRRARPSRAPGVSGRCLGGGMRQVGTSWPRPASTRWSTTCERLARGPRARPALASELRNPRPAVAPSGRDQHRDPARRGAGRGRGLLALPARRRHPGRGLRAGPGAADPAPGRRGGGHRSRSSRRSQRVLGGTAREDRHHRRRCGRLRSGAYDQRSASTT